MMFWGKLKSFSLNWEKTTQFLLKVLLFAFPFQLQILLYKSQYLTGQLNAFTAIFLYAGEVLLGLLFLSFGIFSFRKKLQDSNAQPKSRFREIILMALTALVLLDLLSIIQAKDHLLSWFFVLKDLELVGLYWILTEGLLSREEIIKWLVWGAVFQSLLGIIQFIKQSSLGLNFLGETALAPNILNVAKLDFNGGKLIRAYGTFGHANILGGYLFCAIAALSTMIRGKEWKYLPILIVLLASMLVSFSRSAWLATLVLGLFYFGQSLKKLNWRYWLLGGVGMLAVVFIFNLQGPIWSRISNLGDQAWSERVMFLDLGKQVVLENPWGVGRGNFTLKIAAEGGAGDLYPWLFQPVHNVPVLIIAELGWVGGILLIVWFGWLIWQTKKQIRLWGILLGMAIICMLDHYLITNWAGQIIAILILTILTLTKESSVAEQEG